MANDQRPCRGCGKPVGRKHKHYCSGCRPETKAKRPVGRNRYAVLPVSVSGALAAIRDAKVSPAELARRVGVGAASAVKWLAGWPPPARHHWPAIQRAAESLVGGESRREDGRGHAPRGPRYPPPPPDVAAALAVIASSDDSLESQAESVGCSLRSLRRWCIGERHPPKSMYAAILAAPTKKDQ